MTDQQVRTRRFDPLALIFGLLFLAIGGSAWSGSPFWIFSTAGKWIVCGVIAFVGLTLLFSALPKRRRDS
jgi:hypothetical protein